jgi:hypothetical protein
MALRAGYRFGNVSRDEFRPTSEKDYDAESTATSWKHSYVIVICLSNDFFDIPTHPGHDCTMTDEPKLIPAISQQSALERRVAAKILRLNPGLGPSAVAIANSLCDSGLPPAITTAILAAVYAPTDPLGRGQSTRAKWFVEAINSRYQSRMDKIRTNVSYFRTFVSEMEEISEFRDTLKGEDYPVSFQAAFLLCESGLSTSEAIRLLDEICDGTNYRGSAMRTLILAVQNVNAGKASTVEGAIREMNHAK